MLSPKPFKPGVQLMRALRLPVKLGVLALVLLIPLGIVTWTLVDRLQSGIAFTEAELSGSHLVRDTGEVIRAVQRHRGQTNMLLSGQGAARTQLEGTRAEVQAAVERVRTGLQRRADFDLGNDWRTLEERIRHLTTQAPVSAPEAFAQHTDVITDLRRFVYAIGERSNLLFDPEPGTFFLMDLVVTHSPGWAELVARIRGAGAGELARTPIDPEGLARVQLLIGEAAGRTGDILHLIGYSARHGHAGLGGEQAGRAVQTYLDAARRALQEPGSLGAQAYFDQGTQAINEILRFERDIQAKLEELLLARLAKYRLLLGLTLASAALGLLLLGYFLTAFYLSFVADFRRLIDVMRQTAAGNLRVQIAVRGRDELAELAGLVHAVNANLSGMVAGVRSNSALVAHAGKSLAAGNRDLADRTEQQAANLEQTAASVQELSGTVQQNAQTASDSDQQAARVRDVADAGARAMMEAVASVELIQKSAQQMSDIIGVIDSLAFQTNILALNAAVEAARAGEQGRGFAVVASEVRSLAQRSAASAKEIRQLIETSIRQVESSAQQIRSVGGNIEQIVGGVRSVASNMSLISTASAEQSSGLSEITSAIRQLDEITQRNAQMVERAVEQANLLEHRAAHLSQAVASFQLQQGTAEEAMVMVHRAVEQRSKAGRENYAQSLTAPANGFHDRDMYVFALDQSGVYRAFGGKPEKVGSRVQDIPGVDGDALLQAIVSQAELEPGWVEYDIVNPLNGKVQTKMSYVTRVDDLYVGCGVYKSAVLTAA